MSVYIVIMLFLIAFLAVRLAGAAWQVFIWAVGTLVFCVGAVTMTLGVAFGG